MVVIVLNSSFKEGIWRCALMMKYQSNFEAALNREGRL